MKTKYKYFVKEQTVDVRNFTIETDKPFTDDDEYGKILNAICEVDITKKGDEETGRTVDGVNYKVTYVGTDYGDDGQIDWDMYTTQFPDSLTNAGQKDFDSVGTATKYKSEFPTCAWRFGRLKITKATICDSARHHYPKTAYLN